MSRLYHVLHDTRYDYGGAVALSRQLLHMTPRNTETQRSQAHQLIITPTPDESISDTDWFGNHALRMTLYAAHTELRVLAASSVSVDERPTIHRSAAGPAWESVVAELARYPGKAPLDAIEAAHPSPMIPVNETLRNWARPHFTTGRPLLEATRALMAHLFTTFKFDPTATTSNTTVMEALKLQRGVCQDFTHVMIDALRSLGLAARYMSGYLLTIPAPGKERMIGADASHAWLAVWCPDLGWVEFDPTNNLQPSDEHIVLGWGRDFADISPMGGTILAASAHDVEVEVTVMPADNRSLDELIETVNARAAQAKANPKPKAKVTQ